MRIWLVEKRLKINKSQEYIAKHCEITSTYYYMIEQGLRNPSIKVAKKIAKELNFSWTIFFDDNNNEMLI